MRAFGAETGANYVPVPVDSDVDWSTSLRAAGFDASVPTAWAAEGALPTLPASAWNPLFDEITFYSARGSRIAVDVSGSTVEDVSTGLGCREWEINSFTERSLMGRYHRPSPLSDNGPAASGGYVEGRLG